MEVRPSAASGAFMSLALAMLTARGRSAASVTEEATNAAATQRSETVFVIFTTSARCLWQSLIRTDDLNGSVYEWSRQRA